jgi:PAS domain S-box-containing protein
MNATQDPVFGPRQLQRALWLTTAIWTLAVAASAVWNARLLHDAMVEAAVQEARNGCNKDVIFRRWAAMHGGVYVPATSNTPPNPYLINVAERDLVTPSGRRLTLMNPAYMTRQMHELGRQQGAMGHITSLKPLRPENAPDAWETAALRSFEQGRDEAVSRELMDGRMHLRFMKPLTVEASCLKCHASQGYKEGDIRGGISIAVPMAGYFQVAQARLAHVIGVHVILWGMGVLGICLGARQIRIRLNRQLQAEETLRERIKELNCLYAIADLIEKEQNIEKVMQGSATLLPASLRHPELACARITLEDRPFQTDNFQVTEWRLSAPLTIRDQPAGMIELCYLKKPPGMSQGTFSREEENLVKAVAERLGRVAERMQAEEKLRQLSRAVEQSPASIMITDLSGSIEYVNPKFLQVTGYTLAEVLGKNPRILKSGDKLPETYQELWKTLLDGREWSGEFHNKKKNGELFWESASISPIRDVTGHITRFVAVKEDITARKQTEEERNRLIQELQDALARVKSLSGLLPICAGCKKIRDDRGYWSQVESYIQKHSDVRFSHGLCPDCIKKWSSPQSDGEHQNPGPGSSTSLTV